MSHQIYRDPMATWAVLRRSRDTPDCYRAHAHAEYSIGIVDEGSATFHHPSGPQVVRAGSVVLIEPHVFHSCNPAKGHSWSYRMLFVDAAWLHGALAAVAGLPDVLQGLEFVTRCIDDPAVRSVVDSLCLWTEPGVPTSAPRFGVQQFAFLADLVRPGLPKDSLQLPLALNPAMAILQTEVGERVSVERLAQACGLDSPQFIRQFRKATGTTPGAYLQNLRVNGARRLLSQGMPLADAAYAMGFSDQAHMQRAFKSHHAMTPGTYQKV